MAFNKRRRTTDDGPVKIVGLNHNFCLASELYSEGWVREQFADVLFYCKASKNSSSLSKRNLRANRSNFCSFLIHGLLLSNYCLYFYLKLGVLAASSQFFASFLPQGELENEICISTDLLYSELFCILEYMYSGRLMCTFEKKDEILKLLKEYQVLTNLLKPGRLNSEHFVLAEPKRIIIKQLNFLDLLMWSTTKPHMVLRRIKENGLRGCTAVNSVIKPSVRF